VEGSIAFENRTQTITLSDDSTVEANLLTIGASEDLDAFVGIGGPGDQPGALGLNLDNVNFALALMKPVDTQDDRSWTSLKADVGQAWQFVGVGKPGQWKSTIFQSQSNQSSTDVVADLKTAPLTVETGPETNIILDFDGSEGQLLKAQGNIVLNVFNFFYVEGNLAFENSAETITLSDGSSIETNLLTIGASGLDAFAGINGPLTMKAHLDWA
jgi:hypothetical protein